MGLRPLSILIMLGSFKDVKIWRLHVYRRQILPSKDDPRAERVNSIYVINAVFSGLPIWMKLRAVDNHFQISFN